MNLPSRVRIVEVGPRDGLQNEAITVSVEDRITFCLALIEAGLPVVEPGAFVSPKWVPQMADSEDVFKALPKDRAQLPMLVPNRQGYERARAAGVSAIAIFTAASDAFNLRNTNVTIDESIRRFEEFVGEAKKAGVFVRGYISTCFGCPYEGPVPPAKVADVTRRLIGLGCDEISLGDTIGIAVPSQVDDVIGAVSPHAPLARLAVHFHDTRGVALANVLRALQLGVAIVDSSAGGLGGCPYAPGASGNLATEDLLYMLHGMGIETGVDIVKVAAASRLIGERLGHELPSRYLRATRPQE
ncbi:MAG: hydroxymethylglutaryl-CoA lyase [Vicinamibacteria bacterium]|nr:hydroxymethylglutaryl-CoA lyase [Vicinamibacteria bacterium]